MVVRAGGVGGCVLHGVVRISVTGVAGVGGSGVNGGARC